MMLKKEQSHAWIQMHYRSIITNPALILISVIWKILGCHISLLALMCLYLLHNELALFSNTGKPILLIFFTIYNEICSVSALAMAPMKKIKCFSLGKEQTLHIFHKRCSWTFEKNLTVVCLFDACMDHTELALWQFMIYRNKKEHRYYQTSTGQKWSTSIGIGGKSVIGTAPLINQLCSSN